MAGKGTEASRRAEAVRAALTHEIDRCLAELQLAKVSKDDVAGIDRHLRCCASVARAEKLAQSLAPVVDEDEAEASDEDGGDERDDPDELERLHGELWSRVQRIRANLDAKREEGWTYNPRQPGAAADHAGSGDASAYA